MEDESEEVDVSIVEHREDPDPWKRYSILSKPSYTRCHCNTRTDADIIAEALQRYERFMIDHPYATEAGESAGGDDERAGR